MATALEAAQLSRWLKLNLNPADVLKVQKLDKASDALFDSPQFKMWSRYLVSYNNKNPTKEVTVAGAFTKSYGEEGVLKLVTSLDDGPGAAKFRDEMVKGWLANPDHPANRFKIMKLDEAGDDLLSSPLLDMWVKYMKAYNKEYPFAKTTMIQTFTKSYGDDKLATMIEAATKVPKTEQFAKNLQTAQFKQWMVEKKTPDVVYKSVLKLDSDSSPNAVIWRKYKSAYNNEHSFSFKP
ncbi:hypothetical protein PHYSODRAFT_505553 [Phytophthora sojae]|uniref:RxLR effector PexRD54 WY domain-containing protein n=3 Tax=Phytophthora sojae TaxID=67593 RepID=G4ZPC6_PHYSP|nr:hypothetical protein PHYSODRAFT_505553 [Phytophthora sojae]EGZ15460.1 hypothetical protein PHYSODRAFT_505553 [Phytophthora sojae]|eukprot:XP_009529209.1 hypothetical protein PHYSODRAFT_505553 [Phytophthora sojae]